MAERTIAENFVLAVRDREYYEREYANCRESYFLGQWSRDLNKARRIEQHFKQWVETGVEPFEFVIFRCTKKGCRWAKRERITKLVRGMSIELNYSALRITSEAGCPEHGGYLKANPVNGHFNEKVPCNAACVAAKGSDCECGCGGANHGAAYD
jgi:hypothetical protein